jgi:hypothetical protein
MKTLRNKKTKQTPELLDPSFATGGMFTAPSIGRISSCIPKDDKLLCLGLNTEGNGHSLFWLNDEGVLDDSMFPGGPFLEFSIPNPEDFYSFMPFAVLLLPTDDKKTDDYWIMIFIRNSVLSISDPFAFGIIRLSSKGVWDQNFGTNGIIIHTVYDWGRSNVSDNELVKSAQQFDANVSLHDQHLYLRSNPLMLRLNLDCRLDPTFGDNGVIMYRNPGPFTRVRDILPSQDEHEMLLIGYTLAAGDYWGGRISEILSDGSADKSFGNHGYADWEDTHMLHGAVTVPGTGDILCVGSSSWGIPPDSYSYATCCMFDHNGKLKNSKGDLQFGFQESIWAGIGAAMPFKQFIAVGYVYNSILVIGRYLNDGNLDPAFGLDGAGYQLIWLPHAPEMKALGFIVQANGKTVIYGFGKMLDENQEMVGRGYVLRCLTHSPRN